MNTKVSEAARAIHNMTSIMVRCYERDELREAYSSVEVPPELEAAFRPYLDRLRNITAPIGCVTTRHRYCFGIIRYNDFRILIGPAASAQHTPAELERIAADLDPTGNYRGPILETLRTCPKMTQKMMLPLLANTHQLLSFSDTSVEEQSDPELFTSMVDVSFYDLLSESRLPSSQSMETLFESMIEQGDVSAMQEWFRRNPLFHFKISITGDSLRDVRDCFIMCSAIYAKAACRGGIDRNYSLQLQINAVRIMETMDDENDILQLQTDLAIEFTREVARFQASATGSRLVRDAIRIIQRNLYRPIRVEYLADQLFVSRGHLSRVFREETGRTISSYILEHRVKEAKRLLRYTGLSLSEISEQLQFSSQSHFTKTFKSITGMTPKCYRDTDQRRQKDAV